MCQTFFDVRTFGAVMTAEMNCGQVRGPVQLAFARSVDPIVPLEQALARTAVTRPKDLHKSQPLARKQIVPYALYVAHGFVSPFLAADTGFLDADLDLLWQALKMLFEHDRSAVRGEMASRKLVVFEHQTPLGNAPAHALFERVRVRPKDGDRPLRDYSDYEVWIDSGNLQPGITIHDML